MTETRLNKIKQLVAQCDQLESKLEELSRQLVELLSACDHRWPSGELATKIELENPDEPICGICGAELPNGQPVYGLGQFLGQLVAKDLAKAELPAKLSKKPELN